MGIKSKIIIKMFDRFMNRGLELWNDKGITTTLTTPDTVRTAVGRVIWQILGKTSVKELANKGGCFTMLSDVQQEANSIS